MEHDLEVYLKDKGYYNPSGGFKQFIESNTSVTRTGEAKEFKYEFINPVHKTILNFLKKPESKKFIEKFEKNPKAELWYRKAVTKTVVKKISEKNRGAKIREIFRSILGKELPTTSIIKQYGGRYQQLISKMTFDEEQVELINIGMFFFTVIYHLAKKEEDKTKASVDKKAHEELSTKSEKLDSILDNALSRNMPANYNVNSKVDSWRNSSILALYYEGKNEFYKKLPTKEDQERFYNWVTDPANKKEFKNLPCLDSNLNEGEHKFLYTNSSTGSNKDTFAHCIFSEYIDTDKANDLTNYFFKDSQKTQLILNGQKTGIFGYTKGILSSSPPPGEKLNIDYLKKNLKPIWFRDITKETKKYKQISFEQLREIASSYKKLLTEATIKYIQLTYQCKENLILVSFKTNHFERPQKVLNETEFKELYKKNKGRILYRGLRSEKDGDERPLKDILKKMREKGIAYNVKHHNQQYFGPGIYWSNVLDKEGKFGPLTVMGIGSADLPDPPDEYALTLDGRKYQNMFLQRDNTSVILRHKAMYNNNWKKTGFRDLTEDEKKEWGKLDVVVCDNEKQMDDWATCQ